MTVQELIDILSRLPPKMRKKTIMMYSETVGEPLEVDSVDVCVKDRVDINTKR